MHKLFGCGKTKNDAGRNQEEGFKQQALEKAQRRDSLSQALEARPEASALQFASGTAAVSSLAKGRISSKLVSAATKLKRRMSADNLSHLLDSRPPIEEVVEVCPSLAAMSAKIQVKGHVEGGIRVASSLQNRRKSLERAMTRDSIGHLLESRPSFDELIDMNVIQTREEQERVKSERQAKENSLETAMRRRPSVQDMSDMGLLSYGHLGNDAGEQENFDYDDSSNSNDDDYSDGGGRGGGEVDTEEDYESDDGDPDADSADDIQQRDHRASSHLHQNNAINEEQRYHLKDLILAGDLRVLAACEVCEEDRDIADFLDTLYRVALASA